MNGDSDARSVLKSTEHSVLRKFLHGFVLKSALLFAGAATLAAAVLLLALHKQGTSYADSYRMLAELNSVLISRLLLLFLFTLLLSIAGVIVLGIVYSHRVAGALHKLGMHTRRIASGDLAAAVRLRRTDVIHVLADDMNGLSGRYRDALADLEKRTRALAVLVDDLENKTMAEEQRAARGEITKRIDEVRDLLDQIKL